MRARTRFARPIEYPKDAEQPCLYLTMTLPCFHDCTQYFDWLVPAFYPPLGLPSRVIQFFIRAHLCSNFEVAQDTFFGLIKKWF